MPTIVRDTGPTKTCAVCGQVRPEVMILTRINMVQVGDSRHREKVPYCSDRAECTKGSHRVSSLKPHVPITATRRHAAPGERPPSTKQDRS